MLAMTYMYHGQRDLGLELARRTMQTVIIENRGSWDSILLIRADTGEQVWGDDYQHNLMFWSVPAALLGQDLAGPCQPGGLVDRMIQAGR